MKRRNFILLTSAGVATITIPAYLIYNKTQKDKVKLPFQLTQLFSFESVNLLGVEYLNLFPNENNQENLIELLTKVNKNLELQIIEDYKTDNLVVLDGWILSKTEGRHCALFSLSQTKQN